MFSITPGRPGTDEYAPFFAGYVERVPDGDIFQQLEAQRAATLELLRPLSRERALERPTPQDWNLLEVIGHITDTEQIFAFRALWIGRGDTTPLPGFEQDDYVRAAHSSERELGELLDAYDAQRRATIALLRSFDAEAWPRRGTVSGHPASTRGCAYVIAGHELHHVADFKNLYKLLP
jgi:uncharacterized damage-inducible protein DinB